MMDDTEEFLDAPGEISASEDEGNEEKHEQLLDAIAELDGKKRKRKDLRFEPSIQVSEFNLTNVGKNQVNIHELVGALKDTGSRADVRKKLKSAKNKKVLATPLNKIEHERIERAVNYEKTQKEVSKWLPVVQQNRKAEQITFPLEKPAITLETTNTFVQKFQPRTPLELEVAKLLHGNDHVLTNERMLTKAEERSLKAMNLEEAKARRAELQKYRALLSYKEAKARRQNKIKSKKYHRILKKDERKKGRKALEDLKTSDPEMYAEKLKMLEKDRVQERMSLKHRGGSKYLTSQMMYGKYNKEARDNIQDMIKKNKELTQKIGIESESDDDADAPPAKVQATTQEGKTMFSPWTGSSISGANPWMEPVKVKAERYKRPAAIVNMEAKDSETDTIQLKVQGADSVGSVMSGASKVNSSDVNSGPKSKRKVPTAKSNSESEKGGKDDLDEIFGGLDKKDKKESSAVVEDGSKSKRKRKKRKLKKGESPKKVVKIDSGSASEEERVESLRVESDTEEMIDISLQRKQTLADLDKEWSDADDDLSRCEFKPVDKNLSNLNSKLSKKSSVINDSKTKDISIDPKLVLTVATKIQKSLTSNVVSDEEDEDAQRMTISEAFVDDDVMEEFSKEKQAVADRDKPKDLDLTLPGWGDWGGEGIVVSKKKNKRFRVKAAPAQPRKDRNLDNVILSEAKDNSVAKHQVNNLPYTFNNVKQFESSVRAPIGKTWNPETSFRDLTKPKVVTKLGKIIQPMDEDVKYNKEKGLVKAKEDVRRKSGPPSKKGKKKK